MSEPILTTYEKTKLWRQNNPEKLKVQRRRYDQKRNKRLGIRLYWRETKRLARGLDKIIKQIILKQDEID